MRDMPVEEVADSTAVLRPAGRLDLQTAADFRQRVTDAVEAGRSAVVIDLAGVTFMDSSGLGALIAALKTARQAGGDLRIAGVGSQVAMIMQLTQMDRVLTAHGTVDEALAAL